MTDTERIEWTVLGRPVGTATGWDQQDTMQFVIYDFEPAPGVELPKGDITIDFDEGLFQWDGKGFIEQRDIIDLLMHIRRPQ